MLLLNWVPVGDTLQRVVLVGVGHEVWVLADVVDGGVGEHGELAEGSEAVEGGEVDAAPDALGVVVVDVGPGPVGKVLLVLELPVVEALNLDLGLEN